MSLPHRPTLAAALAVAVTLAAQLSGVLLAPASATPTAQPGITWGACPTGTARDPRQECGTLPVPLDYRDPHGATIEVAVSRIRVQAPSRRLGVLLINPGGPGEPGLDRPSTLGPAFPPDVLAAYDLIGFDPRGVGHSSPISCGLTPEEVITQLPFPSPDGSITAGAAYAASAAERCRSHVGDALRFFTTANTARDMDLIRQALGEKQIAYYGISAGTYLGAVYASLFPARADRVVLDSSVDPQRIWYRQWQLFGPGMAARFPDLAAYAAQQDATVHFGSTASAVTSTYLDLADQLDRAPMPVGALVPLDGNMLRSFTYQLSYQDAALPVLAQAWTAAAHVAAGSASDAEKAFLAQGIDNYAATEPGIPVDNSLSVAYANACGDVSWRRDVAFYQEQVTRDRADHPLLAGMPSNIWPCAFWPYDPIERPVHITAGGRRSVLVLSNERDPATPVDGAVAMRDALGRRAALVRVDAGGHVVLVDGSSCVSRLLTDFLVGGSLPAGATTCPAT